MVPRLAGFVVAVTVVIAAADGGWLIAADLDNSGPPPAR
jgi:hypothetical protein